MFKYLLAGIIGAVIASVFFIYSKEIKSVKSDDVKKTINSKVS
jgi:hypothetical protein